MSTVASYSNKSVVVVVDGRKVTHFDTGDDVVMVEQNSDRGSPKTGADGHSVVSYSADESATITLKLLHSSSAHKHLTRLDRKTTVARAAHFPVSIKDTDTGEGGSSVDCSIIGRPNVGYGDTATPREWKIFAPRWDWNDIQFIE